MGLIRLCPDTTVFSWLHSSTKTTVARQLFYAYKIIYRYISALKQLIFKFLLHHKNDSMICKGFKYMIFILTNFDRWKTNIEILLTFYKEHLWDYRNWRFMDWVEYYIYLWYNEVGVFYIINMVTIPFTYDLIDQLFYSVYWFCLRIWILYTIDFLGFWQGAPLKEPSFFQDASCITSKELLIYLNYLKNVICTSDAKILFTIYLQLANCDFDPTNVGGVKIAKNRFLAQK